MAAREGRLIGGYSMGGAGALRFALARADLFATALVLSPAIYTPLPPNGSNTRVYGAFGVGAASFDGDTYQRVNYPQLISSIRPDQPLRVFIATGDSEQAHADPRHDAHTEATAVFNVLRRAPGVTAHLRILGGGHDWDTWTPAIAEGLTTLLAADRAEARLPEPPLIGTTDQAAVPPVDRDEPRSPEQPPIGTIDKPLHGVKVVELATLFAGPLAGAFLSDFGADVIKVEHPAKPDPSRGHGPRKDGVGLWWKVLGRNKRTVTLNLSAPDGADVLRRMLANADVLIENFRPGTLERWGLGPDVLLRANPRLIVARVSGFGQIGPYARRPGFGTLAEAMSGFAAATGEPDGPPTLPPFGLADSVAALATAYAINLALTARAATGRGQVIDVAIIEPILAMLGPQITWFDQIGYVQPRLGNRSANNAPRNTYRCADGSWVAVSTSAQNIAERVIRLVGRGELVDEDWFASGVGRAAHADELDAAVAAWVAARSRPEVVAAFEAAEAAVAPVYGIADILADPQYQALGTVTTLDDPDLGALRMQNVPFRLSATPGAVRFAGRSHGADTDSVLTGLGLTTDQIDKLRADGVV